MFSARRERRKSCKLVVALVMAVGLQFTFTAAHAAERMKHGELPILKRHGVLVYQATDQPGHLVIAYSKFLVGPIGTSGRLLTFEQAGKELADDAVLRMIEVDRIIADRAIGPEDPLLLQYPPDEEFLGPLKPNPIDPPPGQCVCACCTPKSSSVCECTWGCIKDCFK